MKANYEAEIPGQEPIVTARKIIDVLNTSREKSHIPYSFGPSNVSSRNAGYGHYTFLCNTGSKVPVESISPTSMLVQVREKIAEVELCGGEEHIRQVKSELLKMVVGLKLL